MKIVQEIRLKNFEFWGGAHDFASTLTDKEFQIIEDYLEEEEDPLTETELNDMFWFDQDFLNDLLERATEDEDN